MTSPYRQTQYVYGVVFLQPELGRSSIRFLSQSTAEMFAFAKLGNDCHMRRPESEAEHVLEFVSNTSGRVLAIIMRRPNTDADSAPVSPAYSETLAGLAKSRRFGFERGVEHDDV